MRLKRTIKNSNRRFKKRLAISTKVKIYRVDKKSHRLLKAYLLETRDMTQKGLFLRTPRIMPIGTPLRIEITLSPDVPPIVAEGKVAWFARPTQVGYFPGMGIQITKLKRGEGKRMKDFLGEKFLNYHHALELKKMYAQLKDMAAELYDMRQSHKQAAHFKKVIDYAIKDIDNIAHILDREVWEVKSL